MHQSGHNLAHKTQQLESTQDLRCLARSLCVGWCPALGGFLPLGVSCLRRYFASVPCLGCLVSDSQSSIWKVLGDVMASPECTQNTKFQVVHRVHRRHLLSLAFEDVLSMFVSCGC